jgi:hypothetical protein
MEIYPLNPFFILIVTLFVLLSSFTVSNWFADTIGNEDVPFS